MPGDRQAVSSDAVSGRTATATVGPTDTGRASLRTAGNDPAVRRIRIFYAQNRYHEMSRCEIIVRMARRAGSVMGALLACCNIASALNPSLDINQYAHTAWTVRDGFFKGVIILNCSDARRLSLARHGIRLASLRWRSKRPMAAASG